MSNGATDGQIRSIRALWDSGTSTGLDDGALLARFVDRRDEGAELAFEALVRRHGAMVLRICGQMLDDRHAAEDAFQAVFLVLARRAGSIRRPERLAPWLHGVALRTAKEARKRERARRRIEARGATAMPTPDPQPPEQPLVRLEEAEALHFEIARLPERYRGPVVLCDLEGLTHQEAAGRLRCPTGTVAIRLARARERLRSRLSRKGLGPPAAPIAAALPEALVRVAVRSSLSAGVASASVVSLANGVHLAMHLARWKTITAMVSVALVLGLAAAWGASKGPSSSSGRDWPEVEVGRPELREVRDFEDYVGRIEFADPPEIRPRVSGTLEKIDIPEKRRVKASDVLFVVHVESVEVARANVKRAEAQVQKAEAAVGRMEALRQSTPDRLGRGDLDKALVETRLANSERQAALAEMAREERNVKAASVRAPTDGELARPLVAPGDRVQAGETVLARYLSADPMGVGFDVDERTILRFGRMGLSFDDLPISAALADEEGFPHKAKLKSRPDRLDPNTGTAHFLATIPNPDLIMLPGMFARVRIGIGPPRTALLVPEAAVLSDEGSKFLYLLGEGDRVERRPVTLGQIHEGQRVVLKGLEPTDRVVVGPLDRLKPGMTIKPRPASRPNPEG